MVNVVRSGRGLSCGWNHKDRQDVVEWKSGANVPVRLSRLENSNIARLMASHADVVRHIRREVSRIHDHGDGIGRRPLRQSGNMCATHKRHMCSSGAMASLASNSEFGKRSTFKLSRASRHSIWPAAVTGDAAWGNRAIEAQVGKLISRRGFPAHRPGIERQWRLEQVIIFPENCSETIDPGTDDPLQLVSVPKTFLAVGVGPGLALIELSVFGKDLEPAFQLWIDINGGGRALF